MTTINDLKGLSPHTRRRLFARRRYALALRHRISNIAYRTDPAAIPEPLEEGPESGLAYVAFSKW